MKTDEHIPLFDLDYDAEEEEAVLGALRSKWLTMGEVTNAFEKDFASYIGVKHAIAVSNCTSALHIANLAIGVGHNDEVICPSLTFVATANSIVYSGGTPVFADVRSMEDWTISPEDIEKNITDRTKVVLVVHYAGFSCDMSSILEISKRHGLKVIEDAAHATGSYFKEKKLGSIGDISCFSFFSNKNLSTGEGGMVCTDNDDLAKKIRLYRSHGMTESTLDRHRGYSYTYDIVQQGFNYRIDEIRSALGRVQLRKLDENNRKRLDAAEQYKNLLSDIEQVKVPFETYNHRTNYHIFPILLNAKMDRMDLMQFFFKRGIQTSIHYRPVHTFTYYREMMNAGSLPITEEIGQREITLPMYPGILEKQIRYVVNTLQDYMSN
jgi:dTDP-4-amino-4,6-dideoxygalactose transaminase